jgi:hypothetical protein
MATQMGCEYGFDGGVLLETNLKELGNFSVGLQNIPPGSAHALSHRDLLNCSGSMLSNLSELSEELTHDGTEHEEGLRGLDVAAPGQVFRPYIVRGCDHKLDKGARALMQQAPKLSTDRMSDGQIRKNFIMNSTLMFKPTQDLSLDTGVDPVLIAKPVFVSLGAGQKKDVVLDADGYAFPRISGSTVLKLECRVKAKDEIPAFLF